MTRIITYSLKADSANSDEYYRAISVFADAWLAGTAPQVLDLVRGFRENRQACGEADRSDAEYIFELLSLGVLLREHGREACHTPGWVGRLMHWLADVQNRRPRIEKAIKALRGWVGWMADQAPGGERSGDIVGLMIAWLVRELLSYPLL